jgi:hypothetical protein
MADDIAAQLGSFEYDNKQQLERVEDKIDASSRITRLVRTPRRGP